MPLHAFPNGFPQEGPWDAEDEEVDMAQLVVVAPADEVCI